MTSKLRFFSLNLIINCLSKCLLFRRKIKPSPNRLENNFGQSIAFYAVQCYKKYNPRMKLFLDIVPFTFSLLCFLLVRGISLCPHCVIITVVYFSWGSPKSQAPWLHLDFHAAFFCYFIILLSWYCWWQSQKKKKKPETWNLRRSFRYTENEEQAVKICQFESRPFYPPRGKLYFNLVPWGYYF